MIRSDALDRDVTSIWRNVKDGRERRRNSREPLDEDARHWYAMLGIAVAKAHDAGLSIDELLKGDGTT